MSTTMVRTSQPDAQRCMPYAEFQQLPEETKKKLRQYRLCFGMASDPRRNPTATAERNFLQMSEVSQQAEIRRLWSVASRVHGRRGANAPEALTGLPASPEDTGSQAYRLYYLRLTRNVLMDTNEPSSDVEQWAYGMRQPELTAALAEMVEWADMNGLGIYPEYGYPTLGWPTTRGLYSRPEEPVAVEAAPAPETLPAVTQEMLEAVRLYALRKGEEMNPSRSDRNVRFASLLPASAVNRQTVLVVGTGAVGRRIAQMLAALGPSKLILIDPDTVSKENLGNQQFGPTSIGVHKVAVVGAECKLANPAVTVEEIPGRYSLAELKKLCGRSLPKHVFVAVDNMEVRQQLAMDLYEASTSYLCCRMFGNVGQVWTKTADADLTDYLGTLVPQLQVYQGDASCGGPVSAPWTSGMLAAFAISQFVRGLHNPQEVPVQPYTGFNLMVPTMYAMPYKLTAEGELLGRCDESGHLVTEVRPSSEGAAAAAPEASATPEEASDDDD